MMGCALSKPAVQNSGTSSASVTEHASHNGADKQSGKTERGSGTSSGLQHGQQSANADKKVVSFMASEELQAGKGGQTSRFIGQKDEKKANNLLKESRDLDSAEAVVTKGVVSQQPSILKDQKQIKEAKQEEDHKVSEQRRKAELLDDEERIEQQKNPHPQVEPTTQVGIRQVVPDEMIPVVVSLASELSPVLQAGTGQPAGSTSNAAASPILPATMVNSELSQPAGPLASSMAQAGKRALQAVGKELGSVARDGFHAVRAATGAMVLVGGALELMGSLPFPGKLPSWLSCSDVIWAPKNVAVRGAAF
jgi:hypothetical protein